MSQPHPPLTQYDLADHPELAALQILDCALEMAKFAIIAVHPELTDSDPAAVASDIEVLAAEHVLIGADTLQRLVESYRAAVKTDPDWGQLSLPGVDDQLF